MPSQKTPFVPVDLLEDSVYAQDVSHHLRQEKKVISIIKFIQWISILLFFPEYYTNPFYYNCFTIAKSENT